MPDAPRHIVLLTPASQAQKLATLVRQTDPGLRISPVEDILGLDAAVAAGTEPSLLLSFGTGVIVPVGILARFHGQAVNIHAASPAFPGRDPHHFAAYNNVREYGATAHWMTGKVDEGAIIDTELTAVAPECSPDDLLRTADAAAWRLMKRIVPRLVAGDPFPPCDRTWAGPKRSRRDFLALCHISPEIDAAELIHRVRACASERHRNLYIDPHLASSVGRPPDPASEAFTEARYKLLLETVSRTHSFADYRHARPGEPHVYWRHKVEMSVHRAARLADMEAEAGLHTTYFLHPRSPYYDLLDPDVVSRVRRIADHGHTLGLLTGGVPDGSAPLAIIEQSLDRPISVMESTSVAGRVNAGDARFVCEAACTDSMGVWDGPDPLACLARHPKSLQVTLHPEWWTPTPMTPRDRILRCLVGRPAHSINRAAALSTCSD